MILSLPRLAVLISGGGSNLQAILDAIEARQLEARVAVVVSNRPRALGLERARQAGVPALVVSSKGARQAGQSREDYDAELARALEPYAPDLVVLAGWMRLLTPRFLDRFPGRVLNLHPALPGVFPGLHAIERSFEAFRAGEVAHGGVMVHWVVPEVDAGPPVRTAEVPILPRDTLQSYEHRVHQVEHALLVAAIGEVLGGWQHGPSTDRPELDASEPLTRSER